MERLPRFEVHINSSLSTTESDRGGFCRAIDVSTLELRYIELERKHDALEEEYYELRNEYNKLVSRAVPTENRKEE